jgi:hypothetical protein
MTMASSNRLTVEVSLNGSPISGLLQASILSTNHFSADTFTLTFATGGRSSANTAFWSVIPSGLIEVKAVMSSAFGSTYQSLITGAVDMIQVDPVRGTVGIEGRDLSASMVDSYRQQDFVNQTASEIVSTIALYHGLQPVVVTTNGNIGRYYSDGYTKLSLGQFSRLQSDWDLVVHLARENGFDVFVEGRLLLFQPAGALDLLPIAVSLQDVCTARIQRNLGITGDITAKVQSWSSQNMTAYNSNNAGAVAIVGQDTLDSNSPFLFSGSNFTSQQVTNSAERYAQELTRLGTILSLEMPWDLALMPRSTCLLQGTESAFDSVYRIDSVDRHYSTTTGSRQLVHAVQIV